VRALARSCRHDTCYVKWMILAISFIALVATSTIVLVREVRNAPEGYESESGFLVVLPNKSANREEDDSEPSFVASRV